MVDGDLYVGNSPTKSTFNFRLELSGRGSYANLYSWYYSHVERIQHHALDLDLPLKAGSSSLRLSRALITITAKMPDLFDNVKGETSIHSATEKLDEALPLDSYLMNLTRLDQSSINFLLRASPATTTVSKVGWCSRGTTARILGVQ